MFQFRADAVVLGRLLRTLVKSSHDRRGMVSKERGGVLTRGWCHCTSPLGAAAATGKTVQLSYARFDPPSGRGDAAHPGGTPIVFLHGLFGSKKNFESIAKAVSAKTGRQVLTVDARNHGDSPHAEGMTYPAMSEDLVALLASLNLSRVVVVGHSMGGKAAMVLALSRPELVERLVVEDISPTSARQSLVSQFPVYIAAMRRVAFDQSLPSLSAVRKAVGTQIVDTFPDKGLRDFILTNLGERGGKYCWRINLEAIDAHMNDIVGFPFALTATYAGPTLFVGGGESKQISEPYYPEIRRLFPNVQIQHIPGAGHWVHSEKPHEFMRIVIDFIQGAV